MRFHFSLPLKLLLTLVFMTGTIAEPAAVPETRLQQAIDLMSGYAARTGLTTDIPNQRYLWTDAFAVCNFLGLAQITGRQEFKHLALQLVDRVHHTLGRHRDDDARSGWLSGLAADEGEQHPTIAGLRIGKPLPERGPDDAFDQRLEWDRDGQYFHYLTRWMHALDRVARNTGQKQFHVWARELAIAAYRGFTYRPFSAGERPRMFWKMSIDLSRPQVPSMGQHDPLDGYVTNLQLASTAAFLELDYALPNLDTATADYAALSRRSPMATEDPLGLGGLLVDAYRVQQLAATPGRDESLRQLLHDLLEASLQGLQQYARSGEHRAPKEYRLAFRELGLAIGLHAVERMEKRASTVEEHRQLKALMDYLPLRDEIEDAWRNPESHTHPNWIEHRDINEVMLATALVPDGYLQ